MNSSLAQSYGSKLLCYEVLHGDFCSGCDKDCISGGLLHANREMCDHDVLATVSTFVVQYDMGY